jgi:hypothetical protein
MLWHYNSSDGRFQGDLDGGLGREDLDRMMKTSMRVLIQNGVDAMLSVVD